MAILLIILLLYAIPKLLLYSILLYHVYLYTILIIESEETPIESGVDEPFKQEMPILLGQTESAIELTNLFFDLLNQ